MLPEPSEQPSLGEMRSALFVSRTSCSGLLNVSHVFILFIWSTENGRSRARSWSS